jgi:sialate O-acetylesterase
MSRRRYGRLLAAAAPALLLLAPGAAQLRLAPAFADHMVLQRQVRLPVWGWASPGDAVVVRHRGATASAQADATGAWTVWLEPQEASRQGAELTVTDSRGGALRITDVVVGEVWLCSGQSNMRMEVAYRDDNIPGVTDWPKELAGADCPDIRWYNRFRPAGATPWERCDSASLARFSAVAYYFGRTLHQTLGVPVGLVHASAGGTSIQKWLPGEAFQGIPWAKAYLSYSQVPPWQEVSSCYDDFIAPWERFPVRGVIWYQGESNGGTDIHGYAYRYLLPLLLQTWRTRRGEPRLPFGIVQLPIWSGSKAFRYVREAQLATTMADPYSGLVTTYDQDGHRHLLHPPEKRVPGERLAAWALNRVYGRTVRPPSPPLPTAVVQKDDSLQVRFDGRITLQKGPPATAFLVAGRDGVFLPATSAVASDSSLTLWSDAVRRPVDLRYAWGEDIRPIRLTGADGQPVTPFRTDTVGNAALESGLMSGKELKRQPMQGQWMAGPSAMRDWMPLTPPARVAPAAVVRAVRVAAQRPQSGGIQGPFLTGVDLDRGPLLQLLGVQVSGNTRWWVGLRVPGVGEVRLTAALPDTGTVVVDIRQRLAQQLPDSLRDRIDPRSVDFAVSLHVTGTEERPAITLEGVRVIYARQKP